MRLYIYPLFLLVLISTLFSSLNANTQEKGSYNSDIKLVLQITIDGFRGDMLDRYYDKFTDGGFKYLVNNGVVFTNAHYLHSNTETIVGHTTLATGTHPSEHGMIGNVWFDRENKQLSYNIEDPNHTIVPRLAKTSSKKDADPSQRIARTEGRSPEVILVPTLADTLNTHSGGKSRIFGVSGKDRSAVSMAGKSGKALWFSTDSGNFVTSTYYYDELPKWASNWNSELKADQYAATTWELQGDISTYIQSERDDRPYEADLKGFGRVFPHKYNKDSNKLLYTQIFASPAGDQLLLDFTKELIVNEGLGKGPATDFLSISFSGVDAVNHFFGPSSVENEDVVRRLDSTLADLFNYIDKQVGLDHTLIILSADHGMAEMPEYMTELGYKADRLERESIVSIANGIGKKHGIDEVALFFYRPYIYLDYDKIDAANLNRNKIEQDIADALSNSEGISLAIPSSSLLTQQSNQILEQVKRNHHPSRSGDIYIIPEPYWFLFDKGPVVAIHGSPWRFDTYVPIIFVGPGIKPQKVQRLTHPIDVAPTMAEYIGIPAPASSKGRVLGEVVQ